MTDKPKFVLKLSGINLDRIKAGDIGRLLNDFCKLLDDDFLFFEAIYPGSAVLKVSTEPEYYDEKLDKLNSNITRQAPALEDINKVLRGYSKTNKEIKASILASRTAVNDKDMELIHQIDYCKPITNTFKQNETLIGKLIKPAHGKDDTDHFTILLANNIYLSIAVSKEMSLSLAQHLESLWCFDTLIKFTGIAKYKIKNKYDINLVDFKATSYEIIDNKTTGKAWMTAFIEQGDSGWQALDDPISVWLEERH
ncbi:hypothetical protein [Psychrobacter phenylpyruvicus]|uniref:Uncharacterized protein n=1 Tax=Psychrobacter phenylpyruvicus TaxID=29432 RepID=A0A379LRK0_9GAMM|nr:hypothetical protein [Psychrobacter phenylpyruvicus]SUD92344.1 Uncharacterised protein [Psychrobacter phenylpyruvicus]